jgi:Bcr/CflA subfamily drug resistance transporter
MRLFVILLITPYSGICIDLYVPSLPAISHYFHTTPQLAQWTVAAFLIGYGIAQFIIGPISDSIGRQKLIIVGLLFCSIIPLGALWAHHISTVLWIRFLQGIAMSAPGGIVRALIGDSYSGKKLKHVANYTTLTWALGPILAPGIGGYLQVLFGWQSTFVAFSFYGALLFFVCLFFLPETNQHKHPLQLKTKITDISMMLTDKIFVAFMIIMIVGYGFLLVFNVLGPFLVQHKLGYSAVVYGHMAMILGLGWLIGSLTNRALATRLSSEACLTIGAISLSLFLVVYWLVASIFPLNLWTLVTPSLLLFAAASICFTNTFGFILARFPKKTGTASSLYGSSMIIGTGIMTWLASYTHLNTQFPMLWIYTAFTVVMIICVTYALKKERASKKTAS